MEDIYKAYVSSHNGISYSTIIIFGSFIFLLLTTFLGQGGRVSEVLRKSSFSAILLCIQTILGFLMEYHSPEFDTLEGGYIGHFKYSIYILISTGLMGYVYVLLKKTSKLTLPIVIAALTAALIFEYAYPWKIIFGE